MHFTWNGITLQKKNLAIHQKLLGTFFPCYTSGASLSSSPCSVPIVEVLLKLLSMFVTMVPQFAVRNFDLQCWKNYCQESFVHASSWWPQVYQLVIFLSQLYPLCPRIGQWEDCDSLDWRCHPVAKWKSKESKYFLSLVTSLLRKESV